MLFSEIFADVLNECSHTKLHLVEPALKFVAGSTFVEVYWIFVTWEEPLVMYRLQLRRFFPMFPFDPTENIKKPKVF